MSVAPDVPTARFEPYVYHQVAIHCDLGHVHPMPAFSAPLTD
jgi:hypothetical protein